MLLAQDPTFYRSVHLGGVENIKLQKEALEKEKVRESFLPTDISPGTAYRCWRGEGARQPTAAHVDACLNNWPGGQAEWLSKVVVDSIDFKVNKMVVKDRPAQMERTDDILADPPKKLALRLVRNAHLPSGKVSDMHIHVPTQAVGRGRVQGGCQGVGQQRALS